MQASGDAHLQAGVLSLDGTGVEVDGGELRRARALGPNLWVYIDVRGPCWRPVSMLPVCGYLFRPHGKHAHGLPHFIQFFCYTDCEESQCED